MRAAIIALLCRARIRAGFDTEGRGCLLTHRVPYDPVKRESECCLDILRVVAPAECEGVKFDPMPLLCVTDAERKRGAVILREREAVGRMLVGIQPGASYRAKQWAPAKFAEAAGDQVPIIDLTGETSMRETMGILTHLSLFIGNDTGVSHIAASLGVSTVSLFGPTLAHKWGEEGPRNIVIAAPDGSLSKLDAGPVLAAARSLLETSPCRRNNPDNDPTNLALGATW
jgi:heptosyltransferase-2